MTERLDGKSVRVSSRVPDSKREAIGIIGKAIWRSHMESSGDSELPSMGDQYKIEPEDEADRETVGELLFTAEDLDVLR